MTRPVARRRANLTLQMSEASETAAAKLKKQGLELPDKPESEIPRLPEDITEVGDENLMTLFVQLTAWAGFLSSQLACAFIDERAAENLVEVAEATSLIRDWGGTSKDRVTVAKAERMVDPDVQDQKQKHAEHYAYRKLVEVLYSNVDRDAAAVSRELTRRTSGADPKTRRADRWTR